ncbi:MAG: hypothetical protein F6K47_30335 [Symploca sp. SIO2E6]|nr:hypothetical protein [Symploca sp. SIO2E6]
MLTTSPSRQHFWHRLQLTKNLTPLTIGVALLTALGIAMETKPTLAQSQHYNSPSYRRTISIPRQTRSSNSYPYPGSPHYHDHGHHHSGSSHHHDHHNRVGTFNNPYSSSPYYYDRYNRVGTFNNPYSRSPYYYDRYNRVRRKLPYVPRYNRRVPSGPQIIYDSPGLTIRLGR